jgi:hypothetical protein
MARDGKPWLVQAQNVGPKDLKLKDPKLPARRHSRPHGDLI